MTRQTLSQDVYQKIKHEIVTSKLLPGTPLLEKEISELLDVSRTPVREALHVLEVEGLVEFEARKGARVAQLSRQDLQDAYEARSWVEPNIVEKVARLADSELVSKLEEAINKMPVEPTSHEQASLAFTADLEFHRLIIEAGGNRLVCDLVENARAITRRAAYFVPPGRYYEAREEHKSILKAIIDGDPSQARELMKLHIEASAKRMFVFYR